MKNIRLLFTMLISITFLFVACDDDDGAITTSNLSLELSGITRAGNDYTYALWLKENDSFSYLGSFNILLGVVTNANYVLERTRLNEAQGVLITLEVDSAIGETPSAHRVIAGDFVNRGARMTSDHPDALNVSFEESSSSYLLSTPTDNDTSNEYSGVWFYDKENAVSTLDLPVLNDNWAYESWVFVGDTTLSLGKFKDPDMPDSSNVFGAGVNPGYPAPGGDLLQGLSILPADLRGERLFLSVEPVPDDRADPFGLQPFTVLIADTLSATPTPLLYTEPGLARGIATRD